MNRPFGRRAVAVLAAAALALGAAACGDSDAGDDSGSTGNGGANGAPVTLTLQNCVNVLQVAIAPLFVGQELGFFKDEGIGEIKVSNSAGSTAQCIQLTGAGRADFTSPIPDLMFTSANQGADTGVQCVYNLIRRPTAAFVVDPSSGKKSFADLAGAKVGVNVINSAYIPMFEKALQLNGVDPKSVKYQVTGYGAQVVEALKSKQVDVALYWDYEIAGYPALGYTPTKLELPSEINDLFSSCIAFNKKFIQEKPDLVAGYLRGLTKSLIFAQENPEATVKLFWKAAPTAKPANMSEADALNQAKNVLTARLDNQAPRDSDADKRYGAWAGEQQWKNYAQFLGLPATLDVSKLYTTNFIDKANDFDAAQVRTLAKDYKAEG